VSPMDSTPLTYLKRKSVIKKESRVMKTGAEARESGAKEIMVRKAKVVKDWIIKGGSLLIIVENILPIDEMNKILQEVIEVISIALSESKHADPAHLITKYAAPVSTLTRVIEYTMEGAEDFDRKLEAIMNGRHTDENNNILVLYGLTEGKRDLDSNYVAFVVGKDVDSAMKIIESRLGSPAVAFTTPIDDAPSTYVVLMIPLTLQDLENGPIEMPREYIEEIVKSLSPSSEVKKDG